MSMDTTCVYSVVRNVSGQTKNFTFLPPHGRELADQEEYAIFGSILEAVSRSNDRFGARFPDALEAALEAGDLEIRTLPKPILIDEGTLETKMITLQAGSLVLEDPCWESLSQA